MFDNDLIGIIPIYMSFHYTHERDILDTNPI